MISKYQKRLSGPLLDPTPALRACASVDIHVEVPRVDFEKLSDTHRGEPSRVIRGRIEAARERQRQRFAGAANGCGRLLTNADTPALRAGASVRQLHMSARGYHRTLKLARTIADLAGAARIETAHLAEAIQYRTRWQV